MDSWQVADAVLWQLLKAWLGALMPTRPFFLALFTNQMMSPLSQQWGDYIQPTPSQWPGYNTVELSIPAWTAPQVTNGVATITQPTPAIFALPDGVSPVTIWGYAVSDCYANYLWSYQFAEGLVVPSPGAVQFAVSFNLTVLPAGSEPELALVVKLIEPAVEGED
jgi:hypothetical protein